MQIGQKIEHILFLLNLKRDTTISFNYRHSEKVNKVLEGDSFKWPH